MKNHKTIVALIALLPMMVACQVNPVVTVIPLSTSTVMPTVTNAPLPTMTPTAMPTVTLLPTPTRMSIPVWQILFIGAPCAELVSGCAPSMGSPGYYYSVRSDGTGLHQISVVPELAGLASAVPSLPKDSPVPYGEPQFSPDRSFLVYYSNDAPASLNVVDIANNKKYLLLGENHITGAVRRFHPVCWSQDGTAIKFYVRLLEGQTRRDTFYSVDRNSENLRLLFTIKGLDDFIWTGTCSPDSREMAFTIASGGGLYILDLDSGEWRQILTSYGIYRLRTNVVAGMP